VLDEQLAGDVFIPAALGDKGRVDDRDVVRFEDAGDIQATGIGDGALEEHIDLGGFVGDIEDRLAIGDAQDFDGGPFL